MLETLRVFALEQLEAAGEGTVIRSRHAHYYLNWIEETQPWLQHPNQQIIDRLERDYSNGRAALVWSQTDSGDPTLGLRLAIALYPFWKVRGYLSEGRKWLQTTLAHVPDQTSVLVARAQACAAELARLQDDYADAEPRGQASWSLAQTLGDQAAMALALVPLGWAEYTRNNFTAARQKFQASLELFRALENPERKVITTRHWFITKKNWLYHAPTVTRKGFFGRFTGWDVSPKSRANRSMPRNSTSNV
jgi:hypothetical protein